MVQTLQLEACDRPLGTWLWLSGQKRAIKWPQVSANGQIKEAVRLPALEDLFPSLISHGPPLCSLPKT